MWLELEQEIIADLTTELQNEDDFSADKLAVKVRATIREVISLRHYEYTSMDDDSIAKDLWNYYSVILNVARYDYNMIGAEGQLSHSENDITRTWVDRDKLLSTVYGFVKVL